MVWVQGLEWRSRASSTLAGVWAAALCLAVAWLSHTWGDLALFLMVYLVGAVFVAWRWGRLAAAVAAVVSLLAHDLAMGTHDMRFPVGSPARFIAFLVLVGVAQFVAGLVRRLRQEQREAEVERARSALLSAVSHDLRTPLASIAGAAEALSEPDLGDEDRSELVELIQTEARRLDHLVENLLHMTRLEGGIILDRAWQPLEAVVGDVVTRLEGRCGALPVQVELPENLPPVPMDAALVDLVLTNLLGNALRHAPGSAVEIGAIAEGRHVAVWVRDQGPGVPQADRAHIFDKFTRGRGVRRGGGAGLGLAIARAAVQAHGGALTLEDTPGGGATFRFTLPFDGMPPRLPA